MSSNKFFLWMAIIISRCLHRYHNIKVPPLGHLIVLLSSAVVGEVQQLVGWWRTWFDRFEEWSPNLVSNQRTVWLRCYGVPLHAWGMPSLV
jgi:hypothetical protein